MQGFGALHICYFATLQVLSEPLWLEDILGSSTTLCLAGKSSSVTKVSQDFATRVGWFASESKGRSCQLDSCGHKAGHCAYNQPQGHFSCFLAVGDCHIETTVETTDSLMSSESSAPFVWHIHIGEKDFKALKRSGWDSQICYLDAVPRKGEVSTPCTWPGCPDCCRLLCARPPTAKIRLSQKRSERHILQLSAGFPMHGMCCIPCMGEAG